VLWDIVVLVVTESIIVSSLDLDPHADSHKVRMCISYFGLDPAPYQKNNNPKHCTQHLQFSLTEFQRPNWRYLFFQHSFVRWFLSLPNSPWIFNCLSAHLKILSLPGLACMPALVTPMGQGALPIAISMYRSLAATVFLLLFYHTYIFKVYLPDPLETVTLRPPGSGYVIFIYIFFADPDSSYSSEYRVSN
jgi:hypothetical protein